MYPFDNPDQAPRGTVEQVFRGENGTIRFQGRMDGSGALEEFTNATADPNEVWEMDPQYADAFRRRREGGDTHSPDASYRGEVEDRFRAIDEKLTALSDQYADFRSTFADAMVEITRDIKAVQKGEDATFSGAVSSRAEADVCLSETDTALPVAKPPPPLPVAEADTTIPISRHDFDASISRGASDNAKTKNFRSSRHDMPSEIPYKQEARLSEPDKKVQPLEFDKRTLAI